MPLAMAASHESRKSTASRAVDWSLVPDEWATDFREILEAARDQPLLHGLDVFAGSKGISKSFVRQGLACETFDINHNKMQNILEPAGLRYLLSLIARVVEQGLCVFGPPCKFWIFLTLSNTQRTVANPAGSESSAMAREGNKIADTLAQILKVCHALAIYTIVEHPAGSFLGKYLPMKQAFKTVNATEVTLKMLAFEHECTKPTRLWGTVPLLKVFSLHAERLLALVPPPPAQPRNWQRWWVPPSMAAGLS